MIEIYSTKAIERHKYWADLTLIYSPKWHFQPPYPESAILERIISCNSEHPTSNSVQINSLIIKAMYFTYKDPDLYEFPSLAVY